MINLVNFQKIIVKKKEVISRWDYIATFKPPAYLSIENGNIFSIETLSEASPDFEFVSKKFKSTFLG